MILTILGRILPGRGEGRSAGRAADQGIGCHEEKGAPLVCQGWERVKEAMGVVPDLHAVLNDSFGSPSEKNNWVFNFIDYFPGFCITWLPALQPVL